jgi:hypothetical protein
MERRPRGGKDVEQHRSAVLGLEQRHRVDRVPQTARHEQRLRVRRFAQRLSAELQRELVVGVRIG